MGTEQTKDKTTITRREKTIRRGGGDYVRRQIIIAGKAIDGRNALARLFKAIEDDLLDQIGGYEKSSVHKRQLVRRATTLAIQIELMERDMLEGKEFDQDGYAKLLSLQARVLAMLGLDKRPRGRAKADDAQSGDDDLDPHTAALLGDDA